MSGPVIGLSMIVRDEAETIEACLASVLPHVDRALILDTGSTDGTLARVDAALGAREEVGGRELFTLEHAEWPGHFGQARQQALARLLDTFPEVTHVLWVDGDDVLRGGEGLRSMAEQMAPGVGAILAHYAYATDPAGNLACSHFRERLVAVEAIAGWEGAIHEVLTLRPGWSMIPAAAPTGSGLAAVPSNTWPIADGGLEVVHSRGPGKDTLGRNRAILQTEVDADREAGRVPNPRSLFYLSQELAIAAAVGHDEMVGEDPEWARGHLEAMLGDAIALLAEYDGISEWAEERYQARHRRADYLRILGLHDDALHQDLDAISLLPTWPDAWLGAAESYLNLGNPAAALSYVEAGLEKPYPQTMLILNPLDYTVAAWSTKALALNALGRTDEALREIRRSQALAPHDVGLAHNERLFAEAANRQTTKAALLALDEALARHDENLAAAALLEHAVPYFLRDDPEVADRRRRRRAGVRHVREVSGGYQRYYGDDNEFIPIMRATGTDTPREAVEALCIEHALPRAHALLAGLREQALALTGQDLSCRHTAPGGDEVAQAADLSKLTVIDLGCNDGWLGWWLTAYHGLGAYHGFDLNDRAIDAARAYGDYFPEAEGRCTFTLGDIFALSEGEADAVVSFEVIEHVPDPGAFLDGLASLARDGGRVYVSTPNGAFERGNIADWNDDRPRGHVRAMRARELAGLMLDRGDLQGCEETRDGLVVASFTPAPRKGTLDFYLGAAAGEWSPLDVQTGLGGSETMAVRMATRLAARGWRVRLYGHVSPATVQGVEYLPFWLFDPVDQRDVLIGSRCPGLIEQQPNARHRVLWLHDAEYHDLERLAPMWDEVWTVGAWQAEQLPLGDADVRITRNGISLSRFPDGGRGFAEREPWAVYTSSPDRGLITLLDLWPEVYEACVARGVTPQLHVAYGFTATYEAMQRSNPHLAEIRRQVEAALSMPGVVWRGAMGQDALAEMQQTARVWAYPTDFPEVSCITAMESQAAGLACHTTDVAELPRTLGKGHLKWPRTSGWGPGPGDAHSYAVRLASLLIDEGQWRQAHDASRADLARFDIDVLADEWDGWLSAHLPRTTTRAAIAA